MTKDILALHREAQAIIDDMAEYGLEKQDGRTAISWDTKVDLWRHRVAQLRDRITPHMKESASIKAARAGAQSMYVRLLDYQQSPEGSMDANIATWAQFIRLHIKDKLV